MKFWRHVACTEESKTSEGPRKTHQNKCANLVRAQDDIRNGNASELLHAELPAVLPHPIEHDLERARLGRALLSHLSLWVMVRGGVSTAVRVANGQASIAHVGLCVLGLNEASAWEYEGGGLDCG